MGIIPPPSVGTSGPTLEMLETKAPWRRLGVGHSLLCAVEAFVADASPRSRPIRLALCEVIGDRGFWSRRGYSWIDPPLCEARDRTKLFFTFFTFSISCLTSSFAAWLLQEGEKWLGDDVVLGEEDDEFLDFGGFGGDGDGDDRDEEYMEEEGEEDD